MFVPKRINCLHKLLNSKDCLQQQFYLFLFFATLQPSRSLSFVLIRLYNVPVLVINLPIIENWPITDKNNTFGEIYL